MSAKRKNLLQDISGAVMVEFTAALTVFLLLLFGSVEFANAFYQWNAATKAVQWGARIAAVSDPIYTATPSMDFTKTVTGSNAGDALPSSATPATNAFDITCDGTATSCTCVGAICPTMGLQNSTAFNALVFGRGNGTSCTGTGANIGMCNLFPRITSKSNITVRYQYTGLGYVGRPGGPVPTITVSLNQTAPIQFQFILIGGLMKIGNSAFPGFINMPSFATTVTGEDLNAAGDP